MQPGLSRAIPMYVLGSLFGALIVIVIRGLQGLDPLWDPGPGIIMTVVIGSFFFIWGMGGFDPKMSVHGEHAEAVAEEVPTPSRMLSASIWQISTLLLVVLIVLGGFAALPGGLALTQTINPDASPTTAGLVPVQLPFGGPEIMVSQLVIFAVFIIWAFISLALVAGAIAFIFNYLSQGVMEANAATAGGGTAALPPPAETEASTSGSRNRIVSAVIFVIVFIVLYLFFYYVAIGLIIPEPNLPPMSFFNMAPATQLVIISAVNALVFALLILQTQFVLHLLGSVARWVARLLRRVPDFLQ